MALSFKKIAASYFASSLLAILLASNAKAETFEEALISAYQSHPKLQAERARLREIDESYVQIRSQERLKSNFSAGISGNLTHTPSFTVPIPGFDSFIESGTNWSNPASAQVQLIQPIYQGGRVSALKDQAKSGIMAAREGLRAQEMQILVEVASAYVDILRDEEGARIRRNNVMVLMRQKEAADSRFEFGAGTRTDIAQAEARLAAATAGLAQAEARLQISRASFRKLTGHYPDNLEPLPRMELPITQAEAIRLSKLNNPSIIAATYQEQAGEAAIKAAKSAYKPTVSVSGNLSATRWNSGFPERAESAAIGAQLSIPITTGGETRSRVREAQSARTRLMFQTRDAEREVEALLIQSWAGLTAAREVMLANEVQISAAELALEGVTLEREVGTRNALDVLNAEQELLEAKLALITSRSEVEKAGYNILALAGAFDVDGLSLNVEKYDPDQNFKTITDDNYLGAIESILPEDWR